jgi:putative peptidoglycan lipid II flippase
MSRTPQSSSMHLFGRAIRLPLAEGATQRLNWAQYLYQFPLGVFAIAIATAIFPKLSADAMEKGRENFKTILRQGLEAALFIGLPASVGMIVVRYPIVRLLFQQGNFTVEDTRLVALSAAIYSSAIWAFSLQQILNRAYYALHDTTTPLIWGIVNLVLNTAIEIPLMWTRLGESAMAVGTLTSFSIQAIAMIWMLNRRVGGMQLSRSVGPILKMIAASALMCAACIGVQYLRFYPHGNSKMVWANQLAILVLVGGGVYFAACAAMGIDVLKHLRRRPRILEITPTPSQ